MKNRNIMQYRRNRSLLVDLCTLIDCRDQMFDADYRFVKTTENGVLNSPLVLALQMIS